ncbi:MAG: DNA-processing protein DprA [Vicinamibacteria bacterium]|nr:DNA-processing protein DprA [Vicinamibacteria bacterium]
MPGTDPFLTLACASGVNARTIRALRVRMPLEDVLAHPGEHTDVLSPVSIASLRSGDAARLAETEQARARTLGVRILSFDASDYPPLVREIYDPPAVLYIRGSLSESRNDDYVSIVGSRRATSRGLALARCMAGDLAREGLTVVSGLARGIDSAAHRGALDVHGRTIAILGSGLDRLYPPENKDLSRAIIDAGGAVVTEYAFGVPPYPANFPRRNRIIAGWSRAVVVIEAGTRSGALVTARLALEEGRDVYAVPGWPGDGGSEGANQLIRDGAALVRDAADVAAELGLKLTKDGLSMGRSEVIQDELLQAMRPDQPSSIEDLQKRSGWPASAILRRLTELEIGDRVRRLPGPLFLRS